MAKKRTTTDHIPFIIHSFGTNLSKFNFNPYDMGEERAYPYIVMENKNLNLRLHGLKKILNN